MTTTAVLILSIALLTFAVFILDRRIAALEANERRARIDA